MFGERRGRQRHTVNRLAKFHTESGTLPRDCMITDISESGARIFADGVEIPDQFHLLIRIGEKPTRKECRVAWRLGGEIGVTFIANQPKQIQPDIAGQLREEALRVLEKVH